MQATEWRQGRKKKSEVQLRLLYIISYGWYVRNALGHYGKGLHFRSGPAKKLL